MEKPCPASERIKRLREFLGIEASARAVLHKCEPYQILILFRGTDNLDIEIHLSTEQDPELMEPLLNTRPNTSLFRKIHRFKEKWNEVKDDTENNFRLVVTLAQVFGILIPNDVES